MSEARDIPDFRREARNNMARGPFLPSEPRQQRLELVTQICDWRKIKVQDARAEFGIPAGVFLEHVENESLSSLLWSLSRIAAWLAGHCGRLEPAAFNAICAEPLSELIDKLEEVVTARIDDIRHTGVDLLAGEPFEFPAEGDAAILRLVAKLIDQSDDEAAEATELSGKRPLPRVRKSQSKTSSRKTQSRSRAAKTGKVS